MYLWTTIVGHLQKRKNMQFSGLYTGKMAGLTSNLLVFLHSRLRHWLKMRSME